MNAPPTVDFFTEKEAAKSLYAKKDYKSCFETYQKALQLLGVHTINPQQPNPNANPISKKWCKTILRNITNCLLKLKNYRTCIDHINYVLLLDRPDEMSLLSKTEACQKSKIQSEEFMNYHILTFNEDEKILIFRKIECYLGLFDDLINNKLNLTSPDNKENYIYNYSNEDIEYIESAHFYVKTAYKVAKNSYQKNFQKCVDMKGLYHLSILRKMSFEREYEHILGDSGKKLISPSPSFEKELVEGCSKNIDQVKGFFELEYANNVAKIPKSASVYSQIITNPENEVGEISNFFDSLPVDIIQKILFEDLLVKFLHDPAKNQSYLHDFINLIASNLRILSIFCTWLTRPKNRQPKYLKQLYLTEILDAVICDQVTIPAGPPKDEDKLGMRIDNEDPDFRRRFLEVLIETYLTINFDEEQRPRYFLGQRIIFGKMCFHEILRSIFGHSNEDSPDENTENTNRITQNLVEDTSKNLQTNKNTDNLVIDKSFIIENAITQSKKMSENTHEENQEIFNEIVNSLYLNDENCALSPDHYQLDLQGHTDKYEDNASRPLFAFMDTEDLLNRPTYATFLALLDNYISETHADEEVTEEEKEENLAFIEAITDTYLMQNFFEQLTAKELFNGDYEDFKSFLMTNWFGLYSRDYQSRRQGCLDSSAFEHTFVGETKAAPDDDEYKPMGFHNWLRFYTLERDGELDYEGHVKKANRNYMIQVQFNWQGCKDKKSSIFVGTSPEFEVAVYTLAMILARNEKKSDYKVSFEVEGESYGVQIYGNFRYNEGAGKKVYQLESAFPTAW